MFAYDDIDRNILGLKLTHSPLGWLTHRLQIGADMSINVGDDMIINNPRSPFQVRDGMRAISTFRTSYYTLDYAATATFALNPTVSSALSGSAQYYRKALDYVSVLGEGFAVPGPGDISSSGATKAG